MAVIFFFLIKKSHNFKNCKTKILKKAVLLEYKKGKNNIVWYLFSLEYIYFLSLSEWLCYCLH